VEIEPLNLSKGTIRIKNRYNFLSLDHLTGTWFLQRNGENVINGQFDPGGILAGKEKVFRIPFEIPENLNPGDEYFLNLSFQLKDNLAWADRGYEIAAEQFKLPYENRLIPIMDPSDFPRIQLIEEENEYLIQGENFEVSFEKSSGYLHSLLFLSQELIREPMVPNFWRPQTDNDFRGARTHILQGVWKKAGPNTRLENIDIFRISDGIIKIHVRHFLPDIQSELNLSYTVYGSGDILVDYEFEPGRNLPDIPRIGLQTWLNPSLRSMEWFGRGPMESYWDRKSGVQTGIYQEDIYKDYQMYIKPQESGNKSDVRWATLGNEKIGLLITTKSELNISAWPYTMDDIEKARHSVDLIPGEWITLNVDKMQMGLGGDDSWSMRSRPHENYRIYPELYRYSFRLSPIDLQSGNIEEKLYKWLPGY
jgi:beta-galactosidase